MVKIATAQVRWSDNVGARATAAMIMDPGLKAAAFAEVAKEQAKAGEFPEAEKTVSWIVPAVDRTSVLTWMARNRIKKGDRRGARDDLEQAKRSAIQIPSVLVQSRQMVQIAMVQAEARQIGEAIGTAFEIEDEKSKEMAIGAIAEVQANLGDLGGAQVTALAIEEPGAQQATLQNVASRSAMRTPIEGAHQRFEKLLTPEEKIRFILALSEKYFPKRRHLATMEARS